MEQKFHIGIKALILNENNKILLLKANPEDFKGSVPEHWDLPDGRIEGDDTIEETLYKEIEEELGTRNIEIIEHFDTFISNMKIPLEKETIGLMLVVYRCRMNDSQFKLNQEHLEYRWIKIEDAKKMLEFKYSESFIQKLDSLR